MSRVELLSAACLVLTLFAAPGAAGAGPSGSEVARSAPRLAAARALIERSGRGRLVARIPAHLDGLLARGEARRAPSLSPERLRAILHDAYSPDRLVEDLAAQLAKRWQPERAADARAFFDSPLGHRVAELRPDQAPRERMAALRAYAAELAQSPPREVAIERMRDIDELTGASRLAVQLRHSVTFALLVAESRTLAPAERRSVQGIARDLERALPRLQAQTRAAMLAPMLYDHRALTDEELGDYVAFAKSPGGAWFYGSFAESFEAVLEAAALRAADAVGP